MSLTVSNIAIVLCLHVNFIIIQVIWKRLYSPSSMRDGGTFYQLRNLINRRNVVKKPSNSITACEEFLLVVEAHILSSCMSTLNDTPSTRFLPEGSSQLDSSQRQLVFLCAIKNVLEKFVSFSLPATSATLPQDTDHVQAYAKEVSSLGLLLVRGRNSRGRW